MPLAYASLFVKTKDDFGMGWRGGVDVRGNAADLVSGTKSTMCSRGGRLSMADVSLTETAVMEDIRQSVNRGNTYQKHLQGLQSTRLGQ
jgi:hypothetical protein